MSAKLAGIALAVAAAGLPLAPSAAFAGCTTKHGKAWAWTEDLARFQAWEIVAQLSGNWPIQTDTFRNERYKCNPDGSGYTCLSTIDICK
jgi:hypothetical protein